MCKLQQDRVELLLLPNHPVEKATVLVGILKTLLCKMPGGERRANFFRD